MRLTNLFVIIVAFSGAASAAASLETKIEIVPELKIRLTNAARTEIELSNFALEWCGSAQCFAFAPSEIRSFRNEHGESFRIHGNNGASLELRVHGNLISYRFSLITTGPLQIVSENARLRVPDLRWSKGAAKECGSLVPDCFHDSHEPAYESPVAMAAGRLIFSPLLLQGAGERLYVGEMGVIDYAGAYFTPAGADSFDLLLPRAPQRTQLSGGEWTTEQVVERHEYIAEYPGGVAVLPWRFVRVLESDAELLAPENIRALAGEPVRPDAPWIEGGYGTDEWITNSQIDLPEEELGFRSGINTATYKYYIDFAARFGVRFVHLDAGWSDPKNIYAVNPDVDLAELKAYAIARGVKLMLWVQSTSVRENLAEKIRYLKDLGAAAIMVDFFDRDDATINRIQEEIFAETYRQELMLLMHGVGKIAGQERRWPHIIAWEAGAGHEFDKWSTKVTPLHKLELLFLRNPIGIFDFEGGFRHRWPGEFTMDGNNPFSQGSRANEIAYYALYDSRIQILAGNLGDYVRDPEATRFLTEIPVRWEETQPLAAKIDDHAVSARRSGEVWYVAGVSAADSAREISIELGRFLAPGYYRVTTLSDCAPPALAACAKLETHYLESSANLPIAMAPYGGYVARFEKM